MISFSSKFTTKSMPDHHTLLLLERLRPGVHRGADYELYFYKKNSNETHHLEVILHPAFGGDMTLDDGLG